MSTGLVVAGGRSTRFGDADKAVAPLAGTPMIRRVADRLLAAEGVDALVVNCRADQRPAIAEVLADLSPAPRFAVDPTPDEGPLSGIRTGLSAVDSAYAFVAACDMPFLDPGLVSYLLERAADHDAAVPRLGEWFEPTHAAYRAGSVRSACQRALDRGERRPIAPLDDEAVDCVVVEEREVLDHGSEASFENVNTREEFEAAAARLN